MIEKIFNIILIFLCATSSLFAEPINEKNWYSHKEIIAIRELFNEVNRLIDDKRLVEQKREFEYCEEFADMQRILYYDAKSKVVRKYLFEGGSGDAGEKIEIYYSKNGRIRFIYNSWGNIYGAEKEYRVYLNAKQKIIWIVYQYEYDNNQETSFNIEYTIEEKLYNPKEHFKSSNKCLEKKT